MIINTYGATTHPAAQNSISVGDEEDVSTHHLFEHMEPSPNIVACDRHVGRSAFALTSNNINTYEVIAPCIPLIAACGKKCRHVSFHINFRDN